MPTPRVTLSITDLLPSWQLALRAERKSPATIKVYADGIATFLRWCETEGVEPALDKHLVQQFTTALLENGAEAQLIRKY